MTPSKYLPLTEAKNNYFKFYGWQYAKAVSHPKVFCKKDVLKNFAKFTGKREKKTLPQVFSCEFCKILKNTFLQRTPSVAASEYGKGMRNKGETYINLCLLPSISSHWCKTESEDNTRFYWIQKKSSQF